MDSLRVATWNVHKCVGIDGVFSPKRIEDIAGEMAVDILAMQEVDKRWKCRSSTMSGQIKGMKRVILPQTNGLNGHGWIGNCFYTSPTVRVENISTVKLPSFEPRGALLMSAQKSDKKIFVIAGHFSLFLAPRKKQIEWAMNVMREVHVTHDFIFLMGDMNEWRYDTNPSSSLRKLKLNRFHGDALPTFPSKKPLVGLDRIFSNHPLRLKTIQTEASDHLPLISELV
jgi:endonuclease/exonuclease/phosphatase family metal-dependent hydrolase